MLNSVSQSNEEISPEVEKLLDAANSASQTVAALHVAFMALVSYIGIIVWGTTHKDLLLVSPVKLPVLDVELPLTTFNGLVPWLLVLLHFNLLIQLELLSRKLWNLDTKIPVSPAGQQLRDRLFIFPFTNLIAGRSSVRLINCLLSLIVGVTVIALPLVILLAAQIRFLPYHNEVITWSQRLAVWVDSVMLLSLWPLIASPKDSAVEWWRNAIRLFGSWLTKLRYVASLVWIQLTQVILSHKPGSPRAEIFPRPKHLSEFKPKGLIFLLGSIPLTVLLSIIAVIPGNITLQTYPLERNTQPRNDNEKLPYHFEDWLINKVPAFLLSVVTYTNDSVSCTTLEKAKFSGAAMYSDAAIQLVTLGYCEWFDSRNLSLRNAVLAPKDVPLHLVARAIDQNKSIHDKAYMDFVGPDLQKRDLRFADLYGTIMPKADFRFAKIQGTNFIRTKLQGARLGINEDKGDKQILKGATMGGAELPEMSMIDADLRDIDFRGANLQGVLLDKAKLQGVDLRGADLQAASLQEAELQGADLRGANLQGSNLNKANLQGASLDYVKLQGADLAGTELQGAVFKNAQLQGVDWTGANLDDVYFSEISMDWKEQEQSKLETILKPLRDSENFSDFQERMNSTFSRIPSKTPIFRKNCYSDNPTFLECDYRHPEQLEAYRSYIFQKLIKLACSDTAIAKGIARRVTNEEEVDKPDNPNHPYFGLAAKLIEALKRPLPCMGLAAISGQTREKLEETVKQQK
jgi:uncharacterized protein YjbI with pentapeptide repeats